MQLDINKSLEMNTAVYGEHTNHSDIALSYDNVGNVHTQLGNYDTALEKEDAGSCLWGRFSTS